MKKIRCTLPVLLVLLVLGLVLVGTKTANAETGATIVVNTFSDVLNYPTGSDGFCSLREAIKAANDNIVVDVCPAGSAVAVDLITLEAGLYPLSIPGKNENQNASGDLDIYGSVEIRGAGKDATTIDGNALDRVFHIMGASDSMSVSILDTTIQSGLLDFDDISGGGGGIFLDGFYFLTYLSLSNCRVINNNVHGDRLGGGLSNYRGTVTVTNCTFENNTAGDDLIGAGGGIYNDGTIFVFQSLVHNNSASQGGGIKNSYPGPGYGMMTLENVTVSGNGHNDSEKAGSGIYSSAYITMTNVTLAYNSGLVPGFANLGVARLKNTIIAYHTGSTNCSAANTTSLGNNLEDGNSCGFDDPSDQVSIPAGLIGTEPQDNGGTSYTFGLEMNSPAIDAGSNTGCPSVDQRSYSRPVDGDGDWTADCDIGAFEYHHMLFFPLIFK